ncbi:MAG: AtpZ/AtpI family protein [Candidatus Binatia bacterium]
MPTKEQTPQQRQRQIARGFIEKIREKEDRKLRARGHRREDVWFWLGMFGLVGWSVAIPTVVGIAVGLWIDKTWPSRFSWTLMLLAGGIGLGCMNAWYWVTRESRRV